MDLKTDEVYKRTAIHEVFGGQAQSGISTPSGFDIILIFSGDSGHTYGYEDGWTDEGFFQYTGEGQVGDMVFSRGNKAIRDHEANGKKILLFLHDKPTFVKYIGEFRCVDYETFIALDKDNNPRQAIRFILERAALLAPVNPFPKSTQRNYRRPTKTAAKGLVTSRVGQGYYRQLVLEKFNNRCAVTGLKIGDILIASHIVPWREATDDERLDIENGILLSPNYDALFDRHLISFEDSGGIIVSPLISREAMQILGIYPVDSIMVTDGMKPYLRRHRERLRQ